MECCKPTMEAFPEAPYRQLFKALKLYGKWLPSQIGEAFSKPETKGSTVSSQKRVNGIKDTYRLLIGNSLISLTSVQEIGPVNNPESLQNPIQGFFCQCWPRNRDGFWWCGSGLHVPWRATGHCNNIFTIFKSIQFNIYPSATLSIFLAILPPII